MNHSSCSTFRTGPLPLILMALLAWLSVPVAVASSLYTAEAPLERDTAEGRNAAYADALSQVLSRVTGLAEPLAAPEIAELFPDPARYVLQFRPGENGTLWVTFDGAAIERMLRSANVTVWGDDRPLTLVWLAVDWGQGEREIIAAGDVLEDGEAELAIERDRLPHDPSPDAALPRDPAEAAALPRDPARDAALLRERVQDAALRRGLPVAFPLLDAEDLGRVSFSDVWGGFDDRLLEASRRYGAGSVLVGRMRAYEPGSHRWSWYFGDEQHEWTGEPEAVIAQLAESMAARFAIAGDASLATFSLSVSGIDSVAAFGAVQSYLEGIDLLDELAVESVQGDSVVYRVSCHGGEERLRRVLEMSSLLEPAPSYRPGGTAIALAFRYRP